MVRSYVKGTQLEAWKQLLWQKLKGRNYSPTINLEKPDSLCDLDYVPGVARKVKISTGLSNSFGFGGHNAAIVLKKYE